MDGGAEEREIKSKGSCKGCPFFIVQQKNKRLIREWRLLP
jgi:hypothetical protein